MVLSCIVCQILRLTRRISQNFYTPLVFSAPIEGDPVGILWICLMLIKLEWLGYCMVKKPWQYVNRFYPIPERYWQTYERTDGQNCYINIARQCAIKSDKNVHRLFGASYLFLFVKQYQLLFGCRNGTRFRICSRNMSLRQVEFSDSMSEMLKHSLMNWIMQSSS